jgi:AraC family transcriptional regulator of adaptative response/methylated-DNA-[protein]-cysteine methyltransferase
MSEAIRHATADREVSMGDSTRIRIRELCAYIEAHPDASLTLAALGERAHLSPGYLQRRFKAITGVSPKQYARMCRLRALRESLREGETVTDAIFDAGFGSASRVYEQATQRLGMTPGQYRAGGAGLEISYATASTPLGLLMMAATDRGLCFVQFGEDEAAMRARLAAEYPAASLSPMPAGTDAAFDAWMAGLRSRLGGAPDGRDLPLDVRGTAFQTLVWEYLQRIPAGETRSYSDVAAAIGRPAAVRAVAGACAANRLAVVIPCHRVIRGDGGLGGYRWGVARKQALLEREAADQCDADETAHQRTAARRKPAP